uniref:ENR1 protein n=1 Tax=Catharus ustulatus TaxID=91951 RepID=A0A8C3VGF0_CATUS
MLNQIIRLQAVLEVVSNRTALALDHISDQLTQTRSVIYQIRLAVDYLLADEGGICGKFNLSECCLEIDDKSSVIKNISKEIRKLAYVGLFKGAGLLAHILQGGMRKHPSAQCSTGNVSMH